MQRDNDRYESTRTMEAVPGRVWVVYTPERVSSYFISKSSATQAKRGKSIQEHDRLDVQSEAIIALMKGKPFHAPIENPKRILDVGCGTGSMTYLLAQKYPDAEVIGLDISPVPQRFEQPANLTYIQGNVMELANGEDVRFALGSFDYVFHRLLVFGVTDWPGYVATVRSLLCPCGWAEMQDFDTTMLDNVGKELSDDWWFYPLFSEDCRAMGLDITIGSRIAGLMDEDGSFGNVEEKFYKFPVVPDPNTPEAELVAKANEKSYGANNGALLKRVSGGRRSAEEIDRMGADMMKEFAKLKQGDHVRIFVVVGQKAA